MIFEVVIETVIVALLIATCGYCYILSRRLRALRGGQEELLSVIMKFDEASRCAEKNLVVMQSNSALLSRKLNNMTARAHSLLDELSVMVNAGDNIAGRIEGAVNEVRSIKIIHAEKAPERRHEDC